jgi:hypothetical protein
MGERHLLWGAGSKILHLLQHVICYFVGHLVKTKIRQLATGTLAQISKEPLTTGDVSAVALLNIQVSNGMQRRVGTLVCCINLHGVTQKGFSLQICHFDYSVRTVWYIIKCYILKVTFGTSG